MSKSKPTKSEKNAAKGILKVKHDINEIMKELKKARRPGDMTFQIELLGVAIGKLDALVESLGGEPKAK